MPGKKTHYEILGLPRTATAEQIKRRYRQLARTYHPDVAEDKDAAKASFLLVSEAYQTLMNPDRRLIYDASLDAEMFHIPSSRPMQSRQSQSTRPSGRQASEPGASSTGTRRTQAERWVDEAQAAFIRGLFRDAAAACRQAQQLDRGNARSYVILGDIYRVQGRTDDAIAMYTMAVQLDPRNMDVQTKLDRLVRSGMRSTSVSGDERYAALRVGLTLMGGSMGAFLLAMLMLSPGQPIPWLLENLPFIGEWTTMLISVLLINGALTGFLLSVNNTVQPLDDELVFQSVRPSGGRSASYPILLLLIIFNFFSFYLAAGLYILIGWIQECLSKSVIKALIATFFLVSLTSLVYTANGLHVMAFGGNIVFPALLFGWALGDMLRPGW